MNLFYIIFGKLNQKLTLVKCMRDQENYLILLKKVILWIIIDMLSKVDLFHQMPLLEHQANLQAILRKTKKCD